MRSRLFLALFPVLLALAGPACARGTLDSILPEIRQAHPGRLSDAEPWTDSEGRTHYRIKWMTPEGRILYFNADADSGRYSSSGGDDGARGGGWHRGRGGDEDAPAEDDGGGPRSHWNGDNGGGDTGDWHGSHGGGDGGGDWHHRDRGQGDWRGGGTDRHGGGDWQGGGHGGGDWRGGGNRGDNGGHHHHGGN